MSYRLTAEDMDILKHGSMIQAIRVVRMATDWGLKQCKLTVEGLRSGHLKIGNIFEPKTPCPHCNGTGFQAPPGGPDGDGTAVPAP